MTHPDFIGGSASPEELSIDPPCSQRRAPPQELDADDSEPRSNPIQSSVSISFAPLPYVSDT